MKDLGINCFHFPKHQISSLSLVPTILALVDRNDESVVILKITIDKVCCALQKKLSTSPSRKFSCFGHRTFKITMNNMFCPEKVSFPQGLLYPDCHLGRGVLHSFLSRGARPKNRALRNQVFPIPKHINSCHSIPKR